LKQNPFAGLGFDCNGQRTEYGGKVDFFGQIKLENGKLCIQLAPPKLGPSCRFKRRFGSFNFLQLKPSQELVTKNRVGDVQKLFASARPFVIFGAVFRPFYAKDGKVFLLRTNEIYDGSTISILSSSSQISLGDFINWANPLDFNTNQVNTRLMKV
jgi:RNA-dependent RNA polymerase